ncbi:MAG TPA: GFA family protein [Lysobacter sp.]|nr:GFA family protein [Lysobacter sp.]
MAADNQRRIPVTNEQPPPSLQGSCHCGAVRLTLPAAPETATSCNCSLCRRTGGIWAYYELGSVVIEGHPERTESYIWGDRTLRNFRCGTCGIVTHWEPIESAPGARHGVNLRNFEPALLESVAVRRFDGADTWEFLD